MEINLKKIRKKGKENINQMNDIKTIFKDTTFNLYQFKDSNNNKIISSNDNNIIIKIGITNIYFNKERKIYLNHDNKYKNNINFSFKENKIFIYDLMMYFFIFIILSSINSNINPKLNNDRSIILNINQTGFHKIFFNGNVDSQSYSFRPYEVYINGNQTDEVSDEYNFNQINNIIELKFYQPGTSIEYLFYQCSNITKIDLSNFDTSSVIKMAHLFHGCLSLTSINFTNFKTNLVERMESMFYGCQSLTSLDLSNFETNKKPHMDGMFRNCKNLEYLNLKKLRFSDPNNCPSQGDIFENVPDNIVINMYYYPECFRNQLPKVKCYKIDISEDWELNRYKVNALNGSCMNNCIGDFEFESYGKCYSNCTNGYYINNTKKICKCELEQCYLCPPVAFQKGLCSLCSEGYYPKENDPLNIGEYFKCYKDPIGYYLDTNDNIYKKVINRTENSEIKDLNTYLDSSYIISDNTNFCDTNHPFENILIGECVKYCSINNIINKICILKYKIDETQDYIKEYTKVQDILLENIDIGIISNEFDTSILEKGEDHLIQTEKMIP